MISSKPVVDINVDPLEEVRRRRRALIRIGIPLGGVALMIATILFIAFYSYRANRDGAFGGRLGAVCRVASRSRRSAAARKPSSAAIA